MMRLRYDWQFKDSISVRSGWNACYMKMRGGKGRNEVLDLDLLISIQINIKSIEI